MPVIARLREVDLIADESGMTLVELTVAIAAGLVVMAAVTLAMLTTIRETGRIANHVEANQRARIAMNRIVTELQSACITREAYFPIVAGSNGNKLIFTHQTGDAVIPVPVKTEIELNGTTLIQRNQEGYKEQGSAVVKYREPSSTSPRLKEEQLMKNVSPLTTGAPIFTYYAYAGTSISSTPLGEINTAELAATVAQVNIAFEAAPSQSISGDTNAATELRNSVLLRMTAPSYNSTIQNLPCE